MITLFDVLPVIGLTFGALGGFAFGAHFGTLTGVAGSIIGAGVGLVYGRLPFILVLKSMKRDFSGKTTEQLRTMLRDPGFLAPNVLLFELRSRGEDLDGELPIVLDMLTAHSRDRRVRGWNALLAGFPALAEMLSDYRFNDSAEECAKKVQKVEDHRTRVSSSAPAPLLRPRDHHVQDE